MFQPTDSQIKIMQSNSQLNYGKLVLSQAANKIDKARLSIPFKSNMSVTSQLVLQVQQGSISTEVVNSLAVALSSKSLDTHDIIKAIGDLASDSTSMI